MIADYETRDHAYHGKPGRYSVTELIGCLRAAALKRAGALALETPVRLLGRTMGTVLHENLEQYADKARRELSERGVVAAAGGGAEIAGTIDLLCAGDGELSFIDYKFTSSLPRRIKKEHLQQLRAYRAMLGANGCPEATAWYIAFNGVQAHQIDNDPEADQEVLDWLMERMKRLHKAVESGNIDELEPEGRDRRYGPKKTLCDYCPVRVDCESGSSPLPF